jgi:hypothetical protein
MRIYGVISFVTGIAALSTLAIRRGRNAPARWTDHVLTFVGIAGAIVGIAAIFAV